MATFYIACGGTGGHLYPGLAVAEQLHRNGHEVRLFVSPKKIDQEILSAHPEFKHSIVQLTGFPGVRPALVRFGWQFIAAFLESRKLLKQERPQAVLGMGGFSCAPLLLASSGLKIPSYIHESNVIPGKATRLLRCVVDKVFIGFKSCADYLTGAVTVWTGTPVRSSLVTADTTGLREVWGIAESAIVIAITGGSQGARGLNQLVCDALEELKEYQQQLCFIHLTGSGDATEWSCAYEEHGICAHVMEFSHEIEKIFGAADIVVARSGAATLTECAWFGLPAILVPYPYAAEKHQNFNAQEYVDFGGGYLVEEGLDAKEQFVEKLIELISSEQKRNQLKANITAARVENAVERVVAEIGGGTSHA
ncbi:MAG: undecaprenyldiphospho-muramoylpentapeptide beta-N-acetylglucosaminyltransferase [Verrucomicrobiota bacterium]